MRPARMLIQAAWFGAALSLSGVATAGTPCYGYEVINANGDHVIFSDNPSLSFHLAIGTCQGGADGTCTYRDRDGDEFTNAWKAKSTSEGTWKRLRGTGKYANRTSPFGWYRNAGWVETLQINAWSDEECY